MTAPTQGFGIGRKIAQQPDMRALGKFQDVHGRSWWATTEKQTGHPAAPLRPSGWTAPQGPFWARGKLIPDAKYILFDQHGAHDRLLAIAYSQWLADWDEADADRANLIRQLIAQSNVDLVTLEKYYNDPPKQIVDTVGPGPGKRWPRELIEAMAEGNAWALGLDDKMPAWAVPVVERWERLQDMSTRHVAATRNQQALRYPNAEQEDETTDFDEIDTGPSRETIKRGPGRPPKQKAQALGG